MKTTQKPTRRLIGGLLAAAVACLFAVGGSALAKDPKGSPDFEHSYDKALKKAQEEGKPVIVIFSASWCGPCQAMKKNVYPSSEVQPFHDKFVWAYLDVDEKKNKKVAEKFGVSGIPHLAILDKDGKEIDKQVGSSAAAAFAKRLEKAAEKAGGEKEEEKEEKADS
ncbi:MAG: thioredoxin family protein [Verrucomicrobiales bacterium]